MWTFLMDYDSSSKAIIEEKLKITFFEKEKHLPSHPFQGSRPYFSWPVLWGASLDMNHDHDHHPGICESCKKNFAPHKPASSQREPRQYKVWRYDYFIWPTEFHTKDFSRGQCHGGDIYWCVATSGYWMGTLVLKAGAVIWRNQNMCSKKISNKSHTPGTYPRPLTNSFCWFFFAFGCLACQGYVGGLLHFHGSCCWSFFQAMGSYVFFLWIFGWPHFF